MGTLLRRMIVVAAPVVWSQYRKRKRKQRDARNAAPPAPRG
ncbi:MAG: hypothetical protein U0237_17285 [Thermoleophilia bacterium]